MHVVDMDKVVGEKVYMGAWNTSDGKQVALRQILRYAVC